MHIKENIQLTLIYRDDEVLINTTNQYSDLRELIMDKLELNYFGECGGVGRCVTCLVALNSDINSEEFSCQIPVDSKIANCTIKVIGDRLNPL